jgi:hypothetical protein
VYDPVIALVMRLILEDEERHHGLLKRIFIDAARRSELDVFARRFCPRDHTSHGHR